MPSYIPLLYQAVYDHSALRSGVDMLPFILSSVITTTSSAMILSRTGHYWGILVGGPVYVSISMFELLLDTWFLGSVVSLVDCSLPSRRTLPP
jgi:hypothetical protein